MYIYTHIHIHCVRYDIYVYGFQGVQDAVHGDAGARRDLPLHATEGRRKENNRIDNNVKY